MLSSSSSSSIFSSPPTLPNTYQNLTQNSKRSVRTLCLFDTERKSSSSCTSSSNLLLKTIPLAASVSILLWSSPVNAGLLSGFSGLESVPGPELPKIDFLNKWNAENQKKYAEFDSRFKSSPKLKELLEKSKLNKERNRREIQDKYCLRGAEWGVGDCSTQGMTQEERDAFISMLKKESGGNETQN